MPKPASAKEDHEKQNATVTAPLGEVLGSSGPDRTNDPRLWSLKTLVETRRQSTFNEGVPRGRWAGQIMASETCSFIIAL
jgi:hypothetical protein